MWHEGMNGSIGHDMRMLGLCMLLLLSSAVPHSKAVSSQRLHPQQPALPTAMSCIRSTCSHEQDTGTAHRRVRQIKACPGLSGWAGTGLQQSLRQGTDCVTAVAMGWAMHRLLVQS